jgi:hypothetical protein
MAVSPAINIHVYCKHYILETVVDNHYCFDARIPPAAQTIIKTWGLALRPTIAAVATYQRCLIGFCRAVEYDADLSGCGTWVDQNFRRLGIAEALWRRIIVATPDSPNVFISTASPSGAKLFLRLSQTIKNVKWKIE